MSKGAQELQRQIDAMKEGKSESAVKAPKTPKAAKAPKAPRAVKAARPRKAAAAKAEGAEAVAGPAVRQMGLNTAPSQRVVYRALRYAIDEKQFEGEDMKEAQAVAARLADRGCQ